MYIYTCGTHLIIEGLGQHAGAQHQAGVHAGAPQTEEGGGAVDVRHAHANDVCKLTNIKF